MRNLTETIPAFYMKKKYKKIKFMIKMIVQYYRVTINSISCLRNSYVNYGKQQYQSRLKDR